MSDYEYLITLNDNSEQVHVKNQQVPNYSNYEYVFSSNEEEELVYVPSDQLSTHEDDFEDDRFSITPFVGDEFQAKKQSERVFNFKWLDIVAFKPWLLIDPKNRNIVRCSFCNRSYSARFNVLKDHCLSTKHLRNCPTLPVPKEEDFDIPSNDKSSHVLERSRAELKMVAMAAFLNIPLNNISEMSDCISEIKHNDPNDIFHSLRLSTTRSKCLTKHILGDITKQTLAQKLRSQPFTICVDESTDVSKDKLLAIEVRFFDFEDLKVKTFFWDLYPVFEKNIKASATAERLFQCINLSFSSYNVPLNNIHAISMDGCSTMTGRTRGVKALLEAVIPNVISIRCPAHITHLVAKHAVERLPKNLLSFIKNVNAMLKSSNKLKDFASLQNYMDVIPHKILAYKEVRWLSLENTVFRLLEQWDVIFSFSRDLHLEKDFSGTKVYLEMFNTDLKCYFRVIERLTGELNRLNLLLQREDVVLHVLSHSIEKCFRNILSIICNSTLTDNEQWYNIDIFNPNYYLPFNEFVISDDISISIQEKGETMMPFLKSVFNCVLSALYHFQNYFINDFNLELIQCISCLRPENATSSVWRDSHPNIFTNLMQECNWFHTDDDFFTSVQNQWDNIVNFQFKIESEEDVVNFWGHMFNIVDQDGNCLFNDVATFSLYILATPHSNVFPERRFSDMNNRKTKTTNRLSVETLNSRIMTAQVKKLFNTTEFEPTKEMLETAARGRFYDNKYKELLYID
ncbi:hypothetical protein TKK_0014099 [Trichogramma kaykai]